MITAQPRYSIVSRVLGFVLIGAGLLKGQELLSGSPGIGSWIEIAFARGVLLFEVLFGLWLVLGLWPRISWWLAAGCFVTFLGVALNKAVAGESSCGCFGRFTIPPWYTVAFDATAILALALSVPRTDGFLTRRQIRWRLVVLVIVGIGLVSGIAASHGFASPRSISDQELVEDGETIRLTPDQWVNKPFALIRYIEAGDQLASGNWVIMFYRAGCQKCDEAIPLYVGLARQLADGSSRTRVALVEMPPFVRVEPRPADQGVAYLQARLSERHRWVLNTPHFALLKDGVVIRSTNEPETLLQDLGAVPVAVDDGATVPRLFPDYRKNRRDTFLKEIACGPLALIAVLNASGVSVGPAEVDQLIGEAGNEGIDLLRLKQLAEQRGLHTLGVAVSPEKLKRMGHKAIVRMNKIGFAAVTGFTPDGVVVAQPLRAPGVLPDSVFDRAFGDEGVAMLVSHSPLDREKLGLGIEETTPGPKPGPHLRFSRSIITAGRIHRSNWQAEVTITNDGAEPLVVHSVETTCTCFSASIDAKEIPPGGSTKLRAKGVEQKLGSFTYRVILATNQIPNEKVSIPVRGYVEQPVGLDTPAIQFPSLLPGEPFECEVGLDIPATIRPDQLWAEAPAGSPLTAQIRQATPGRHVLAIRSTGVSDEGWHRWQINTFIDKTEKTLASPFHLAVRVVPVIDLSATSAYVSDDELSREWSRRVVARPHRPMAGDWKIAWANPRLAQLVSIRLVQTGDTWAIALKPTVTGLERPYRGRAELVIEMPSGSKRSFILYLGGGAFEDK